ncbi:prolactin-inducible protein [Hippopotamus amphibius kiboko]|uniref:prolactin-inducible protein n=1 Tax=Hippopotamus amphibius kiboko TaxID=575201 RepID=UPI002591BE93|nr:prolactin-inducible protein [Hippopotamus amphibius kiboko]
MYSLHLLLRASPAALLLILCLQLGTNRAQEDTTSTKLIIMDVQMPQTASANEEVNVQLTVTSQLKECMVIKAYLLSHIPVEGAFNYKYTTCLCEDYPRTFYWDFQTNSTVKVAVVVDVVRELNICPNDRAVIPIEANRFYVSKTLTIT